MIGLKISMHSILNESELKTLPSNYILYFYATWMPRSLGTRYYSMVDKVSASASIVAVGIDVESFKSICKIYDVTRVPTSLLFRGGEPVKKLEGYMLTSAFRAVIREVYNEDDILNKERDSNGK